MKNVPLGKVTAQNGFWIVLGILMAIFAPPIGLQLAGIALAAFGALAMARHILLLRKSRFRE
ncbi:hypothetical protein [Mycetocola zhadangensis]|uniref:Uncharacterized protein n=1 Tax=Mycetocola zhadangensis TaxID=1164595 RepID=A0A3L7J650_9MICO|nr:hypothetical protein [Mycetocola zhadangensis]RLQ84002.1 hypothetical protein D9V28_07080 [Mycetocola zhadangensis]GGE96963.1 hypothetical protein GCM10011313_20010 [Mycetocola zhadangensis]